jgi:hypothetical protein
LHGARARGIPLDTPPGSRGRPDGDRAMDADDIGHRLAMLRTEHRDLDAAIVALGMSAMPDQLQIARLKKRKLRIKDEISQLGDELIPDIIA